MPGSDNYETPKTAWEAILPYIPRDKEIYDPFYLEGVCHLKDLGLNVLHDKIDFWENSHLGDIIVSNPPFSNKRAIINHLYEINKPFILILPLSILACQYFTKFIDDITVIIPKRRIQFLKDSQKTNGCTFDSAYFCWKMNIPEKLIRLS